MLVRSRWRWAFTGAGESANPASTSSASGQRRVASSPSPTYSRRRSPSASWTTAAPSSTAVPRPPYTTRARRRVRVRLTGAASRARRHGAGLRRRLRLVRARRGGREDGVDVGNRDDGVEAVSLLGDVARLDDLAHHLALGRGAVPGARLRDHVLLEHRAAEVVAAEVQRRLRDLVAHRRPGRLVVHDVVEHQPGGRGALQVLVRAGAGRLAVDADALGLEGPRDERREAAAVAGQRPVLLI